ncbi:MAG: hypothetical protein WEB58_06935 [Planctomycetaceae bacterium]
MSNQPKKSFRLKNFPLARAKHMISHTTILILSVFLLGLELGNMGKSGPNPQTIGMVSFGLICWLGLGQVSIIRKQRDAQLAMDAAISQIEARVDRHIKTLSMHDAAALSNCNNAIAAGTKS